MGAMGIASNYHSELDPNFVGFKASNFIIGEKMHVHKSAKMVNSIIKGLEITSPSFVKNNFKGANNIGTV